MGAPPAAWIASSLTLTTGLVLSSGLGLVFHLLAARLLEPEGYGNFSAALTYATIWATVMEGGTSAVLTREAAAEPGRLGWIRRLGAWKLGLTVLGVAGAATTAVAVGLASPVPELVVILAVGMAAYGGMRLGWAALRAIGAFTWEAGTSVAQKLLLLGFLGLAWLGEPRPATVALAFSASYAAGAVLLLLAVWRPVRQAPAARPPALAVLWRRCVPLTLVELLTNVYFRMDQVMLVALRGPVETGLYGAAYRVLQALQLPVSGLMAALFPRLARAARGSAVDFGADFVPAWRLLWATGLGLAINGWLWAADLVPRLFGEAYDGAREPLRLLLAAVPLLHLNALLTQTLIAKGRDGFYAAGAAVCAAVNIGANAVLIPGWGAAGAAWATLLTEVALGAICLWGLRSLRPLLPAGPMALTAGGAVIATAAGLVALPDQAVLRALVGVVVSLVIWEAVGPWPLRRAWRVAARS
jgi:O-antigen/teichoic acid export membrane protein